MEDKVSRERFIGSISPCEINGFEENISSHGGSGYTNCFIGLN